MLRRRDFIALGVAPLGCSPAKVRRAGGAAAGDASDRIPQPQIT
jgi:hypothetical protein